MQGSQVGKVTALDADKGANADISYDLITEWGKEVFSLDPATGIFTLTAELDYERTEHYIFVVAAADNGSPSPLSSTVTVYVNVKDVNDNPPVFSEAAYASSVAEDVAVGASILQVCTAQYLYIVQYTRTNKPLNRLNKSLVTILYSRIHHNCTV